MGFLFACGFGDFVDANGRQQHTRPITTQRKMGVVMVRIGAPRELDPSLYQGDPANYKRDLGAYISPRDLTQLIAKAVETPNIDNEHGIPWQGRLRHQQQHPRLLVADQRPPRAGLRAAG